MPDAAMPHGVPRLVWLLVALHGALLVAYALAYPTYQAPDEPAHVDLVTGVRLADGWPAPGSKSLSPGVVATAQDYGRRTPLTASGAPSRGSRPSLAEAGAAPDRATTAPGGPDATLVNQLVQHPPLYYAVTGLALRAVPGSERWPADQAVLVLRLLGALTILPLPLLGFQAGRRLTGSEHVGLGAAAFPLAIPQLTRTGASVNNDTLLVALLGVLTVALVHVATGDLTRRTASAVAAAAGLAMLVKGLALFTPLWIALAYALGSRDRRRDAWGPAVLAVGGALAVGGWWWVRNLARYGALQPGGYGPLAPVTVPAARPATVTDGGWDFLSFYLSRFQWRFWGALGVTEPPSLPWVVTWVATVAVLAGSAVAVRRHPAAGALLLAPAVSLLGIVMAGSWARYQSTRIVAAAQGRYLYGAVVPLAVLAAAGWCGLTARRARGAVVAVLAGAGLMQTLAAVAVLRYYWGGSPRALLAWSPAPTVLVVAVWLTVVGLAIAVALLLGRAGVGSEMGLGAGGPGELLRARHGRRAE